MGVRIRLTEEKRKLWMEPKSEAADVRNPEEDKVPAITLTTRQPYSALGTSMQLVGVKLVTSVQLNSLQLVGVKC